MDEKLIISSLEDIIFSLLFLFLGIFRKTESLRITGDRAIPLIWEQGK